MEESLRHLDEMNEELSSQVEGREFDKSYIQPSPICHLHYKHTSQLNKPNPGEFCNDKESVADITSDTPVEQVYQYKVKKKSSRRKPWRHYSGDLSATLPRTSRWEWSSLFHTLKAENLLQAKNWKFITFQNDFLSMRTERADQTFAALVCIRQLSPCRMFYTPLSATWKDMIPKTWRNVLTLSRDWVFRWIFKATEYRGSETSAKSKKVAFLHTGRMVSFEKGLLAMTSGFILMIPVGILLRRPTDKWKCLAVVVCFGAAFIFVMVLLDKKLDKMLIGFSAYSAVLVTYSSYDS
ncbi:hypothetical protein F5Y00DRAFT_261048 [Daldinia vernicosa]|uniref:uncharacterized protein n=1 Tax=Daldinia vernicosa TaxID=114800 RepID=UPI00200845EC|nr:uncharacterized protein F5Y00DRAFT_261048 [Daldinia vernicosa]KAI0849940.1 hypothetical protein F5Y00DRAFT_261048 [Daldinia vernicosa]